MEDAIMVIADIHVNLVNLENLFAREPCWYQ